MTSGWTSAPFLKAQGAGIRRLLPYALLRSSRAICCWWRLLLGRRLPPTLGGPTYLFGLVSASVVVRMGFGPAFKSYGAGMRRLKPYALLRSSRARFVCGWRLHPRATPTPHPRRPDVPIRPCQCVLCCRMGLGLALVGLRGRTANAVRTRCSFVARAFSARPGLMAGRPAGELC